MGLRLAVFPNDPLSAYVAKGEVKPGYFNPCGCCDEIHFFPFADSDVSPEAAAEMAGNARVFITPLGRLTPWNYPGKFSKALAALRQCKPGLVRAFNPRHVGAPAVYAACKLGIQSVVSIHADLPAERSFNPSLLRQLCWFLEGYSFKHCSAALAVSEHVAGYARERGARRIEVIFNKVYASRIEPKASWHDAPKTIICVGRMDKGKRQDILIQAMAKLPQLSQINLRLIGSGEEEGRLRALAASLNLAERVQFVAQVPNARIFEEYRAADLFAIATDHEGFCIPVLEAMATALPCIVCDTQPLPEVLGGCGLVVKKNASAFAEAIATLCADAALRQALAHRARERALAIDGTIMEAKEAELYRSLAGK